MKTFRIIQFLLLFITFSAHAQVETEPNNCFQSNNSTIQGLCQTTIISGEVGNGGDTEDVWVFDSAVAASQVIIDIVSSDVSLWVLQSNGLDTFLMCDWNYLNNVTPASSPDTVNINTTADLFGFYVYSNNAVQPYEISFTFEQNYCQGSPCPDELEVVAPVTLSDYRAKHHVYSAAEIQAGSNVHLGAADSVKLLQGFEVKLGAILEADNSGCN